MGATLPKTFHGPGWPKSAINYLRANNLPPSYYQNPPYEMTWRSGSEDFFKELAAYRIEWEARNGLEIERLRLQVAEQQTQIEKLKRAL